MGKLHSVNGDATAPSGIGPQIIAHICNDLGGWGRGFVLAVSAKWREPELEYRRWYRNRASNDSGLGAVQFVKVEPELTVANMVAQHGIRRGRSGPPPIRYAALEQCLDILAAQAATWKASVHMPRIGAGLAGGDWSRIVEMINIAMIKHNVQATVYSQ